MKSVLIISLLMIGACVDVVEPEGGDEDSEQLDPTPKLATNALTPQQLWNASLNSNTLDQTNADAMAATADGRASLAYVVGCALAPGNSVTAWSGGIPFTFSGNIGLAPNWKTGAMTTSERQWVSACTLARINQAGLSVTVSLRGPQGALGTSGSETSNYTLQEGAFFGNVFTTGTFYVGACKGSGTAPTSRRCAQPQIGDYWTECDLRYAGPCNTACSAGSGYFTNCNAADSGTYAETVTTYLDP